MLKKNLLSDFASVIVEYSCLKKAIVIWLEWGGGGGG